MSDIIKSVLLRFVRAGLAGAVSTMIVVVPLAQNWTSLQGWLSALALAGVIGFITGVLTAGDKYLRSNTQS
jgi:hypothetical protein